MSSHFCGGSRPCLKLADGAARLKLGTTRRSSLQWRRKGGALRESGAAAPLGNWEKGLVFIFFHFAMEEEVFGMGELKF